MTTTKDSLDSLVLKLISSLTEFGRWHYKFDIDIATGPWREYLEDRKSKMRIGCILNDHSKPGHHYILLSTHLDLSLEQKLKLWNAAHPLFLELKAQHDQTVAHKLNVSFK
jgi:hypothetical protein